MLYALNVIADFSATDPASDPRKGFFSAAPGARVWNTANALPFPLANTNYPNDPSRSDARVFSPSIQASNASASSADQIMFILRVVNADGTRFQPAPQTTVFYALFSRRRRHANFVRRSASPFAAANNRPKTIIGPDLSVTAGNLPTDPLVLTSPVSVMPVTHLIGSFGITFEFTLAVQFVGPDGGTYQLSFDPELDVDVNS